MCGGILELSDILMRARAAVKAPVVYGNERLAAEIKAWLVERPGAFMGFMDGVKAPVVVGNGQMRWGIFQKKHSANSLILKIQILTTRSLLTITQNSECAYINAV